MPRQFGNSSDFASPVGFIAFRWPAFWWIEYYCGLHRYLRSYFRCMLENDCVVVFDLRA